MSILDTATNVMRFMARHQREVWMIDLVDHLDMPKSSASRVLKQMTDCGLLERDKQSLAYRPSMLLLELSHLVRSASPLIVMCAQALETLGARFGHTGYISVLEGNDVVVLRVQPGSLAFRATTHPGHRSASWATSTGRALLARESDQAIRARFASGLRGGNTPPTAGLANTHAAPEDAYAPARGPATLDALLDEITVTRTRGYALAENEALYGVCSLGCAVADPSSGECLAFCLSLPAGTRDYAALAELGQALLDQAITIGRSLGDPFWVGAER
ncbi:IclR family transcriptional regulator C-terminal domain-containing protein [Caballeronia sp. LZ035]|uniref:IclR family transcriptional regulator n=1 Tax=Caballeronia sp. LZ035 TaxID=3038568 RepID=UPI0028570419|nr:IclR family transcriptional regulator C-terminal domain-containing protein [Caballeronia sp. LZ035]MDR5758614.1 IclR family transcriptional regulator C-terminal domain-containing protein [Caballeronia sp. LZ035]